MKPNEHPTDEQILERSKRGWLRPYLLAIDQMFSKRWDYWLRTLDTKHILDEPIPKIMWSGSGAQDAQKNLETCIDFCRNRQSRNAFNLFVEWLLFGFGDPAIKERPKDIELSVNAFWYKTFNLGLFLRHPHDYLGEYAAELYGKGKHNPTAYFPTPMHVSVMMAEMTMSEADKTASVCDPCVGSGRLLMAASNHSLNLYGMDIDYNIINVCKVNMWMYVPWGVVKFPFEGEKAQRRAIEQGDSLMQPIRKTTPEVQEKLLKQNTQLNLFESIGQEVGK